jgi:hypothetical protein
MLAAKQTFSWRPHLILRRDERMARFIKMFSAKKKPAYSQLEKEDDAEPPPEEESAWQGSHTGSNRIKLLFF